MGVLPNRSVVFIFSLTAHRCQLSREMRFTSLLTVILFASSAIALPRSRRASDSETERDSASDLNYVRDCNQTSPVSLHTFNEVLVHKRLDGGESDSEQYKFQCFLHCLFTKYGWVSFLFFFFLLSVFSLVLLLKKKKIF